MKGTLLEEQLLGLLSRIQWKHLNLFVIKWRGPMLLAAVEASERVAAVAAAMGLPPLNFQQTAEEAVEKLRGAVTSTGCGAGNGGAACITCTEWVELGRVHGADGLEKVTDACGLELLPNPACPNRWPCKEHNKGLRGLTTHCCLLEAATYVSCTHPHVPAPVQRLQRRGE